jgi:hypothetical protein
LKGIVLHEMAHVLGIGTLWSMNGLYDGNVYSGPRANAEYQSISGRSGSVPIEKDGGAGTAGGHWDEVCMNAELMTGYVDADMKISRITLGALEDLGYTVAMNQADPFVIPASANCSNRRGLRRNSGKSKGRGVRQLTGDSRRQLSDAGRDNAIAYGEKVIKEKKEAATIGVDVSHFSVLYIEDDKIYEVDLGE